MPDRDGGDPADTPPLIRPHHPDCRRGWLGTDTDGHPIPCLQCKPHLTTLRRNLYE